MSDQTIYLDTSAIVQRYIIEEETNKIDKIDKIYEKAHVGKIRLSFWKPLDELLIGSPSLLKRGVLASSSHDAPQMLNNATICHIDTCHVT